MLDTVLALALAIYAAVILSDLFSKEDQKMHGSWTIWAVSTFLGILLCAIGAKTLGAHDRDVRVGLGLVAPFPAALLALDYLDARYPEILRRFAARLGK